MEAWYDEFSSDQEDPVATDKAKLRAKMYNTCLEEQAVRALAQAALLKKEALNDSADQVSYINAAENADEHPFVYAELQQVRSATWPNTRVQLQLCSVQGVYANISASTHRSVLLRMFFTADSPCKPLVVDVESQNLHADLQLKLQAAVCHKKCEQLSQQGAQQVLPAMQLVASFLQGNLLAAAYEELKQLQQLCKESRSQLLAANEKQGTVQVLLKSEEYYVNVLLQLAPEYPEAPVEVQTQDTNIPQDMSIAFATAATGLARRLTEPPTRHSAQAVGRAGAGTSNKAPGKRSAGQTLHSSKKVAELAAASADAAAARAAAAVAARQRFAAQPALFAVVRLLLMECLQPLAAGRCAVCNKRLLPSDPANLPKVPKRLTVLRLDCGHFYHTCCIEAYLAVPPFEGKGCHTCSQPVGHWKLVTNPKVLQGRWAAQQAREREISEVADFLSA